MKQEFEKIQIYKVDAEDALNELSAIEGMVQPRKNTRLEFRFHRLRSCLEHMFQEEKR